MMDNDKDSKPNSTANSSYNSEITSQVYVNTGKDKNMFIPGQIAQK